MGVGWVIWGGAGWMVVGVKEGQGRVLGFFQQFVLGLGL